MVSCQFERITDTEVRCSVCGRTIKTTADPLIVHARCVEAGSTKSRGLGDTVAKITRATGIEAVAKAFEAVTGKPCGCKKRQEALNRLVPYG